MQNSPLVEIQEFLLALFMSRAGDLGRDEVRELARKHWIALNSYLKDTNEFPVETPIDVRPPVRAAGRGDHRRVERRFAPRHRQIA